MWCQQKEPPRSPNGEVSASRADWRSPSGEVSVSRADWRSPSGEMSASIADWRSPSGEMSASRADWRSLPAICCWVRLLTLHNRLNSHMSRKLKLASSPTCPCIQENQTTEHVLKGCPLHRVIGEDLWALSTLPWRPNTTAASRNWRRRLHWSPERPWSCSLRTPRRKRTRPLTACTL